MVVVTEPGRAGLANDVRDLLPNAIDVRLQRSEDIERTGSQRRGHSPHELFSSYLAEQEIVDERLERLFASLLAEVVEDQA
jgi:exonuclease SbcD